MKTKTKNLNGCVTATHAPDCQERSTNLTHPFLLIDGKKFTKNSLGYYWSRTNNWMGILEVVYLHRYIYEKKYGKLDSKILVHHKDGNVENNNIENLEAVTKGQHSKIHCIGHKHSEETKTKMSINHMGSKNPMYGKYHGGLRIVLQFDKNNNFIKEWRCINDVFKNLNIKRTNISRCCRNFKYYKTAGGYIWKFKETK